MSNKPKRTKKNITKISAGAKSDANHNPDHKSDKKSIIKPSIKPQKTAKKSKNRAAEKPLKEVFLLVRPFVAFGRYLRDSWREIRQVRWPSRKLTWKMALAVLIYCAIFVVFIVLLDTFFTFVFNLLLNAK